ncbi:SDR family NAD(P)-dependent oxidoreductase [Thiomicrorhabdus sp. Milos-T2]|uniref:SDR family NAD(P)-dependent oxidoreductase n=1 Tax=Thiomicrorhabdus sp. Milos-T2 TaxID=90814 RepID=UPI00068BE653|nr:SDR family NAD(P)-dependent oxidoreductase [Thiomicrorhabdus sp. Milos-T2]
MGQQWGEIDVRFRVNTLAPYILAKSLLENLTHTARVVNLASAAQEKFDLDFLKGKNYSNPMQAYSESKLALIAWTFAMAQSQQNDIQFIAINPGSLLATKMVKDGFGIEGKDLSIGSDLLVETAISDKFINANGLYFDNDIEAFAKPNKMAMDLTQQGLLISGMNQLVS